MMSVKQRKAQPLRKCNMDETARHEYQAKILDVVRANPGINESRLITAIGKGKGVTTYFIDGLIRAGALERQRDGWMITYRVRDSKKEAVA